MKKYNDLYYILSDNFYIVVGVIAGHMNILKVFNTESEAQIYINSLQ